MHTRTRARVRGPRNLVVALLAASLLLVGGTANAETTRTFDKVGDGVRQAHEPKRSLSGDIQRFRVDHKLRKVRFRIYTSKGGGFTEETYVWVDTDPRDPGPERLLAFNAEVNAWIVYRVERFGFRGIKRTRCGRRDPFGQRVIDVGIDRGCFGFPQRLRVSVQTAGNGFEARQDWAPGVRRFGRWVGRA